MTNYSQETNSQSWGGEELPYNYVKSPTKRARDIISQEEGLHYNYVKSLTKRARNILPQIKNPCVAEQFDGLISIINKIVNTAERMGEKLSLIPPLHAYIEEDGAVSVEWIFPDFRIGFNIEPNPDDSGWHLVAGKNLENITKSGQLKNREDITILLLDFILSNI